ncbi:MAG: FAD-binding oxidoreductase [Pseudomonadota bacterium]|nr:FAD-binding oxidoreductase [Pseudomonadota bacterium]
MPLPEELAGIVGAGRVVTDEQRLAPYLEERRGLYRSHCLAAVFPASTAETAAVVKACAADHTAIVPQGGNTGLCGGAASDTGQILLNLSRLNGIRDLDADNFTLTAEAGCVLADLQRAAAKRDRYFPLSLGAEGSCQIGGNLATNAGGMNVLHYGNARDLTLGLEVVLADGRIWNGLNTLRKNNTGYDLKNLFIGAEGTLGIITAAALKLFPAPRERVVALAALPDLDASVELLGRVRSTSSDRVSTFELIPRIALDFTFRHLTTHRDPFTTSYGWYTLIVLHSTCEEPELRAGLEEALAAAFEEERVLDAVIADSHAQADALLALREALVEAQRLEGASIKHDVSVPVSSVPDFLRAASRAVTERFPGARPYPFGHLGDGNIHLNISQPEGMPAEAFLALWEEVNAVVFAIVQEFGGSFSAEHGIGLLKLGEMAQYKDPVELALMRDLKRLLDPRGLMNPGKVVPW